MYTDSSQRTHREGLGAHYLKKAWPRTVFVKQQTMKPLVRNCTQAYVSEEIGLNSIKAKTAMTVDEFHVELNIPFCKQNVKDNQE